MYSKVSICRMEDGISQKSEVLSDLTLANVEALAGSGETTIECCLALWGTCKGDIKAPYVCASR